MRATADLVGGGDGVTRFGGGEKSDAMGEGSGGDLEAFGGKG